MIYPIDQLIHGQELVVARENELVKDALVKMVTGDFSQLPIVDEQGRIAGIISEKTISRISFHLANKVDILNLKVTDCSEKPETLPPASDVLDALEILKRKDAIVVVQDSKPIGIVTNADAVDFFRDLAEGIVLVEDIEMSLRQYIGEAFPTEGELTEALNNALKHLKTNGESEELSFERLTFGGYVSVITNGKNWPRLEKHLDSKELFRTYMEQVRDIRNQLMHFRGHLDSVQFDALKRAHQWLEGRRRRHYSIQQTIEPDPIRLNSMGPSNIFPGTIVNKGDWFLGKYGPLQKTLEQEAEGAEIDSTIALEFKRVEEIINADLPNSARQHRAWWANDSTSSRQALAWMEAGWAVDDVDFSNEVVRFKRTDIVLYQLFWADLVERLKAIRPGFTRTSKSYSQNWCSFSAGKSGFSFAWSFSPDRSELWTQLFIDTRHTDSKAATVYFRQLEDHKNEIEQEFGEVLIWDDKTNKYAVRIYTAHRARINASPDELEVVKHWAIESLQRLADTMQPWIGELH